VVGEFSTESPFSAAWYVAQVEWAAGAAAGPGSVTVQHTSPLSGSLTISGSFTYSRPFTGTIGVRLSLVEGELLGTWATTAVDVRNLAHARLRGQPILAAILGAAGTSYEIVFRLDRPLPHTRSGQVEASIDASGVTSRVARFGSHRPHDCYAASAGGLAAASPTIGVRYPFTLVVGNRTLTQVAADAPLRRLPSLQSLRRAARRQLGC
jgi:hypothetical protein